MWCFAFSHTSTFELIPAVAMAQPGAVVTIRMRKSPMFQLPVEIATSYSDSLSGPHFLQRVANFDDRSKGVKAYCKLEVT